jgi:hypothetical protein
MPVPLNVSLYPITLPNAAKGLSVPDGLSIGVSLGFSVWATDSGISLTSQLENA